MLRIDLSALSQTELRRLLAAAQGRGQGALADQLQAELATRKAGGASRPPPPPAFDDDETEPMVLPDHLPELWLGGEGGGEPPARRRPAGVLMVGLLLAGGAAAWGLNGAPGLPRPAAAPPRESPAMVIAASTPPVSTPRAMVARIEPVPAPKVEPTPTPEPVAPARAASVARPEPPGPRRLDPCATPPTPADRALCNDLGLNLLDHEMREAYGRAMTAGADPVRLRAAQTAWRAERDPTSDARTLARLYDRRISELKALAPDGAPENTP